MTRRRWARLLVAGPGCVLAAACTRVPASYPQLRSPLVVRHDYLVDERYWQGIDASDGPHSFSVTKSLVSALVGIALRNRHLQGLDQTVEELLADQLSCRPTSGHRWPGPETHRATTMAAGS
jgi:hypothetical protein